MTKEETITLLSLNDAAEATIIKKKLETEGITCFVNNQKGAVPAKTAEKRNIDLRVYLKDLDKALKMISEDERV
ncbi:MAG TPA: DUF2007 domain-containing protein [Bacteroidia bacterium]|nr:DUF2007 domain-containing protein [Bacteroidia bacterium]